MTNRSDRRGEKPEPPLAFKAGQTIGSPRADFIMARSVALHFKRPEIRVQSDHYPFAPRLQRDLRNGNRANEGRGILLLRI